MKLVMHVTGSLEQLELVRAFCKGSRIHVSKPRDVSEYSCRDCGKIGESYMVHSSLWKEAHLHPRENCCLRCLEIRLGRILRKSDFPDLPINGLALHSYDV